MSLPRHTLCFPFVALCLSLGSLAACSGDGGAAAPDAIIDTNGPKAKPDVPLQPTEAMSAFKGALAPVIETAGSMTLAAFLDAHTPKNAAAPLALSYDPLKAKYLDLIENAIALQTHEKALLAHNGFVVLERKSYETMGHALLDVFEKDLPVLVTTDAILQALHSSYDDILKRLERDVLVTTLADVLATTHAQLPKVDAGTEATAKLAATDADFYLTVARSLLAGKTIPSLGGAAVDAQVADFVGHVAGLQMKEVTIFGLPRVMDFSQFKPRGHYEGDPVLEAYFRAMMWLGRADLRYVEYDAEAGQWLYRSRQLMASIVLKAGVDGGGAMAAWHQLDDVIGLMVGPVDYIDFGGLGKLVADKGWKTASDVATMSKEATDTLIGELIAGNYGAQKIASHYLACNPYDPEPAPLPASFAFLGQRFVVDSYVFANVVFDRVVFNGQKVLRPVPNPLDAMFVLGNDQVLPLLAGDFAAYPYWGALHVLRFLVDSYDDAFWTSNIYNQWLYALRALNAPTTGEQYPQPMRTPAWRDKTVQTQLASWAQLRHDTLLYAKQSYTGGVACQHPDGWVEPYPEFYARLEALADTAGTKLAALPLPPDKAWLAQNLKTFFGGWKASMATLEAIADKELKGEQLTTADVAFIKSIVMKETMCGGPIFTGWYRDLYFEGDKLSEFKPTIADVHTNPNKGDPIPGPNVLHVATSRVDLLVLAADTCEGAEAFVGPVFRYHEVDPKEIKRYADSDWLKMLTDGTAPPRPAWTSSFAAPMK